MRNAIILGSTTEDNLPRSRRAGGKLPHLEKQLTHSHSKPSICPLKDGLTNVFRNSYSAAENRLTYNFLCTLDLMTAGQRGLIEFLLEGSGIGISATALVEIRPLFAFEKTRNPDEEASNPDGCIKVRLRDSKVISIFLEIKTHRRLLTSDQLNRHINCHVTREPGSLLLVITPRPSDGKSVQNMNSERVIFVAWRSIADYLRKTELDAADRKIVDQFLAHSEDERELMGNELETEDIALTTALCGGFSRRHQPLAGDSSGCALDHFAR